MAIIIDPDNLDRWQVLYDPVGTSPTIALKALGVQAIAKRIDGQVLAQAASNFVSAGGGFTAGVDIGDIVTVAGKPTIAATGVIRHYTVTAKINDTTLTVTPQPGNADTGLTFKINDPTPLAPPSSIQDGVTLQCIYSFSMEEWRTLSDADMPDLNKFVFPLLTITREQFEIGGTDNGNWDFYDADTRNLVRTGGWMHRHTDGLRKSDYFGNMTLGPLDSDAQAYFQQVSGGSPTNYVLTGPVNQAIQTYGDATHGNFDYTTYLTLRCRKRARSYAQSSIADINVATIEPLVKSFALGHAEDPAIVDSDGTIQGTEDAANKYQYVGPTAVDSGADGVTLDLDPPGDGTIGKFTSATGSFDTDLEVGDVLEIEEGVHIGYYEITKIQSATELHVDTSTSGAWTSLATLDWKVWTRVRSTEKTNGSVQTKLLSAVNLTFASGPKTITRAAGVWADDGYVAQGWITTSSATNPGPFLIKSIDSATQITVVDALTSEGPLSYQHSPQLLGRITSVGATFQTDGVAAGDQLLVTDATTAGYRGCYPITTVVSETVLEVDTFDQPWPATAEGSATFRVLKPGMHLQYRKTTCSPGAGVNLTFAAGAKTITRAAGNWRTDGHRQGSIVTITSGSTLNLKTFTVASVDSPTVITVLETVADEGPIACNWTGYYGFKRQMSATGSWYCFNWRMLGNTGNLSKCYQKIQRELRNSPVEDRTGDIDDASTVARGDITDLLMYFASPTGLTYNVFIDDLASTDYNNATYRDATGTARNFPFLTSITINISATLINDPNTKIVLYWTNGPNQFGTASAVPVQDASGADMESLDPGSSPISFTYNYDASQSGHGGGVDEYITLVGSGAGIAQYVIAVGQVILRANENVYALVSPLDRVYSNP